MSKITLQDLTKRFPNGVLAVDGLTLEVEDGEFLVLVGPSGCGKTTTLRLIAGLEPVSSGSIQIGERDVTHLAPKDRDVSMVFQNYALWPHMSVRENLWFGSKQRDRLGPVRFLAARLFRPSLFREMEQKTRKIARQVQQTAELLEIEGLLDRKPGELSGGQQQRVAMGRALVRHPKVFLFDEPLSNLDAGLRFELRRELRRLHARFGTTMIYVTHDQVEAMTLGSRIAIMDHGRIRQVDSPQALYESPIDRFVAGFLGSPPMNFLSGTLQVAEGNLEFQSADLTIPLAGSDASFVETTNSRKVILGVRPEHILLEPPRPETMGPFAEFRGNTILLEPLGSEAIVHLRVGETTLWSKSNVLRTPPVNSPISFYLSLKSLYLFDPQSGKALRPEHSPAT